MTMGPKRRQLLAGLTMIEGTIPLSWLRLPFQHLAEKMQDEGLVRFIGNPPYICATRQGRKALAIKRS